MTIEEAVSELKAHVTNTQLGLYASDEAMTVIANIFSDQELTKEIVDKFDTSAIGLSLLKIEGLCFHHIFDPSSHEETWAACAEVIAKLP